ncbi:Fatty acid synthase subunit alpha [Wickerhamiella sorbophila]|uniref:Fatty acid synthase subunit alpha n=1 Tax=Wickerhamiella sorbophila TaxID=45607 RepID=A0A2T0FJN7_9ASCO|nr:Fatty acid synthase subunit alpha [Wickerhamiella sorbophila]PRT55201.1 Fatty acid synthase subunit alpha [Wickerhamiella sorbophila]
MKPQVEQELAHVLLTELLAYQFASPVRWIETQDVLLGDFKAERLVEVGPSATLAGMAERTLKANYQGFDAALSLERQVLCYAKDGKEIYYEYEPEPESAAPEPAAAPAPVAAAPVATAAPTAAAASAAPAAAVDDVPLKAIQVLHALVAHKIRKPLDQVPTSKAIKDMVGGKSTVQNEILGDLAKEFSASPEKAEEVPLAELAEQLGDNFSGKLGKHTTSLISKFIASKMPGGFAITSVRKYLQTQWGLGSGRQDAVLLIALTKEPSNRLSSEADAKEFLDAAAQAYATAEGISLSSGAAAGAGQATGGVDPAVSAAAIEEITKDQKYLARQQLEIYARYLQTDLRDGQKQFTAQKEATALLQKELDLWLTEHGEFYAEGIQPIFSPLKSRIYDSYWNWARQECFRMLFDIVWGRLDTVDREIVARCISIMNRANPTLIDYMVYYIENVPTERGPTFELAKDLAQQLMENCKEVLGTDPVFKDVQYPTGPKTTVNEKGGIEYQEVPRPACRKLEQYVLQMAAGDELTRDTEGPQAQLEQIYAQIGQSADVKAAFELLKSRIASNEPLAKGMRPDIIPFLHLKERVGEGWKYSRSLTTDYLNTLEKSAREGVTFANKMVLITGAGRGSIGVKILEGLLAGGAKVAVTTSRFSKETTDYYQDIYARTGSAGSSLVVVPFNQASQTDVKALIDYIYSPSGLGWDLDAIIPFAAIPEGGMEIDGIESKSELAHRLMLTNLLRLLGQVKLHKEANNAVTRPAQVILPLSPNHGTFGGDGLYSESKLALETLFNRWSSESWGSYLTICGAVIGWTRGTGLMSQNNIVAEGIEKLGVRTFSQQEMAFNILGLLTPTIVNLCQKSPVFADLNGGMQFIPELKSYMATLRKELIDTAELRRAVAIETSLEHKVVNGPKADSPFQKEFVKPRSNLKFEFPSLKPVDQLPNPKLKGLIDLDKVAVVTGFAEVGPWGNSRTRWEMEAHGEFSIEGAIEMAWIMGLIKYHNGPIKGKSYTGWVDAKTGEPVEEMDIKAKYEPYILEHSGIRLIEPDLLDFDPNKKQFLQEVIVAHDLEPFEASKELAEQFQLEQGDNVEVFPVLESDQYTVRFLKGARIWVPKALQFNRLVAGQIPTGWDARRYGIPDDIIEQVDPISLYALVSTVEALLAAGITDPYEFYKYVHVSEIGNASGSGMGGMTALRKMFKDRFMDKSVQNDILQESFINTMSAWINMLLISSSGPIKTPVGACATAVESLDTGVELIRSGAARVVIVGGYDDLREEGIQEFGNMNATSNSLTELEHGRTPREMSRPTTTTRSGFMEAHGSGIQILMSGQLAVDMGVPIYGIVALTATATDKIGRSVPAPGKGIMTVAREAVGSVQSPLLDINYRIRQLDARRRQIAAWAEEEKSIIDSMELSAAEYATRLEQVSQDSLRQLKEAQHTWGTDFYNRDPRIAPLRGALAVWGMTIDDIGIASFHGTSTKANDKNESAAIHNMLSHLGRTKGNPVLGIFQKYLTGHPKGAAGAWMLNGVMQALNSGLVPGNRNADNVDSVLEEFDHIVFPSVTLETYGIKAGTVTSFGFGQKGAIALVIHPDYLFSVLEPHDYQEYSAKVAARHDKTYRYLHDAMSNNTMFRAKDKSPYTAEQEQIVYLNPEARVDDEFKYSSLSVESTTSKMLKSVTDETVGVDVELISAVNIENETFLNRNFTEEEQKYCRAAPDVKASFAGTWSAKEAVFKCLRTEGKGAGAPLKEIEIIRTKSGPTVRLVGDAERAAKGRSIQVSISHNDIQAVAVAVAGKSTK